MDFSTLLQPNDLSYYIAMAVTTPLGIPAVLILVNRWRVSRRGAAWLALCLEALLAAFFIVLYRAMGSTPLTRALVAVVTPVVCFTAFILLSRLRDGRLLFSIITAFLLAMVTEAIACMVVPRWAPLWLVVKVGATGVELALLACFCQKPYRSMLAATGAGWVRLSMLPLALTICLVVGYIRPVSARQVQHRALAVAIMVTALLVYLGMYWLVITLQRQNRLHRESALLSTQVRFMQQQAELLLAGEREDRAFRHDLRHFVGLLQGFLAAKDLKAIEAVLATMEADLARSARSYALRSYTGNTTLDAVLSLAADQAAAAGITFEVRLTLPDPLPADTIRLAVVLSNALENALNACRALPAGTPCRIAITGGVRRGQVFLSITNTCGAGVQMDPDTGLPLTDLPGHGYGTRSIAAFAEDHGALLHYSVKDGVFRMDLLLPAPAPAAPAAGPGQASQP